MFLVNLTTVQLLGTAPEAGAAPSIKRTESVAKVYISENDNARGVIEFNVQRVSMFIFYYNQYANLQYFSIKRRVKMDRLHWLFICQ